MDNPIAYINKQGAILLGRHVACDGFEKNRRVGVITHAHDDHLGGFETYLINYPTILATPQTLDLVVAKKGEHLGLRKNLRPLDYKKSFQFEDETVTLLPSPHMLGSAQVLVENKNGNKFLYTGDFRPPKEPVKDLDVLVVDSTYSERSHVRNYTREDVIDVLVNLVKEGTRTGPVWITSELGKIQEVANILNERGIKIPFIISDPENLKIIQVYKKYGISMGSYVFGPQGADLLRKKESCVVFCKWGTIPHEAEEFMRIRISGWSTFKRPGELGGDKPVFSRDEKYHVVALSGHADFRETLDYIKRSNPEFVIADDTRKGSGVALAEAVQQELGIPAIKMP